MTAPQPSPTPGPSPSATPKSVPKAPTYQGSANATPTSSTSNPNDVWNLGNLYGQPVYLGTTQEGGDLLDPRHPNSPQAPGQTTLVQGQTQDVVKQVLQMYAAQAAQRRKSPGKLTAYEELQKSLWQAGFYGQTSYKDIHAGQWTSQTQDALTSALKSYETVYQSGTPMTFSEFVNQNAAGSKDGGYNGGAGLGTPAAQVVNLTDPAAIKSAAQSAAQAALGQGLSDQQLNDFVAQFQAQQTAAQAPGVTTSTMPDLSSSALQFAQTTDPQAYKQEQLAAYQNTILNMFLPSESQRPSMSPVASVGGSGA